jgi:predicted transcriptional regulator
MTENTKTLFSQRELTPEEQQLQDRRMSNIAKVLSNPIRLRILRFLARQNDCYSGSLHEELGIPRATISQNLKMLKDVGLIQCQIESPKIRYCINRNTWDEAWNMFQAFYADCVKEKEDSPCC